MRTPVVALVTVLATLTVAGCGVAERRDARQADDPDPGPVATATAPAPEDGGAAPADPGAPGTPDEIVPTDGLTEEEVIEIETALIDAEAVLSSIEAELARDE